MLPKKTFILFSLAFFVIFSGSSKPIFAQEQLTAFDSVYMEIVTNVRNLDIDRAIDMTDSLYQNAKNDQQRIKSALLLALCFEEKGKIADAIYWATQSEKIAIQKKDYEFQVRSAGYLATLYRRVDLNNESERHIKIAEAANAQRKSEANYFAIQSVIHHEKAFHESEKGNYEQALLELAKSEDCIKKMGDHPQNDFALAGIYETFTEYYLVLKDYEKAKEKAVQAISLVQNQSPELTALLENHLGAIELHYKNYDQTIEHLEKAEKFADQSQKLSVQFVVYKTLAKYFKAIEDFEKTVHYNEKVSQVHAKRTANIKQISNELMSKLHHKADQEKRSNQILILLSIFLILSLIAIVVIARVFIKRKNRKYKKLIKRFEDAMNKKSTQEDAIKSQETKEGKSKSIMTPETEERLLEELEKLEKDKFFINKEVTLSTLTSDLNSNNRYVSYIIKTHKKNDFKNYINELRVYYIIQLLREQPEYLDYKLAYIAEISGFSSHSQFTQVFKKVSSLTPSEFISEVRKENKKSNLK